MALEYFDVFKTHNQVYWKVYDLWCVTNGTVAPRSSYTDRIVLAANIKEVVVIALNNWGKVQKSGL